MPEWIRHLLDAARGIRSWGNLASVGSKLPAVRETLEHTLGTPGYLGVRPIAIELMGRFHVQCAGIRPAIRPILWRYFWEGGPERQDHSLENWVPRIFDEHMVTAFPIAYFTLAPHPALYAMMWFDPCKVTPKAFGKYRDRCRDVLGIRSTDRGYRQYPFKKAALRWYVELLNVTIRGDSFCSIRNEPPSTPYSAKKFLELRRAWNAFLDGEDPQDCLVEAFLAQYEADHGVKKTRGGEESQGVTPTYLKAAITEYRDQEPESLSPVDVD